MLGQISFTDFQNTTNLKLVRVKKLIESRSICSSRSIEIFSNSAF